MKKWIALVLLVFVGSFGLSLASDAEKAGCSVAKAKCVKGCKGDTDCVLNCNDKYDCN